MALHSCVVDGSQIQIPQSLQGFQDILVKMGVDQLMPKVAQISQTLDEMQKRQGALEDSLNFTQQEHMKTQSKVSVLEKENQTMKSRLAFMESRLLECDKNQKQIRSHQLDAQFRSMKNNLTFHNIPEQRNENIREVLINFINDKLQIEVSKFDIAEKNHVTTQDRIWIARCHRYGQAGRTGTPRPIVAVFLRGKDVVLENAKQLAKTSYFISTQLPQEIAENKKKMLPLFKSARNQGFKPKFVGRGDTVLVDGTKYESLVIPPCRVSVDDVINHIPVMNIHATQHIIEKGNRYAAHIANATTPTEVSMAVNAITHTGNNGVSSATHNMYAARVFKDGRVQDYCYDDGEHGGARCILEELQQSNITNRVVVVSRWFGEHLGSRRFGKIRECTRAAIQSSLTKTMSPPGIQNRPVHSVSMASPESTSASVRPVSATTPGSTTSPPAPASRSDQKTTNFIRPPVFNPAFSAATPGSIVSPAAFHSRNGQMANSIGQPVFNPTVV